MKKSLVKKILKAAGHHDKLNTLKSLYPEGPWEYEYQTPCHPWQFAVTAPYFLTCSKLWNYPLNV